MAWSSSPNDFPALVRAVLKTAPEYEQAEFVDGFFEREVELGSPGRNSQTDPMVIAGLNKELGIIAVEWKVEESFAELVTDWNGSRGKQRPVRTSVLTETLGLDAAQVRRHPISTASPNGLCNLRSKTVSMPPRVNARAFLQPHAPLVRGLRRLFMRYAPTHKAARSMFLCEGVRRGEPPLGLGG